VVPVESPPLEIIPDPVEDRIPAYRHYRTMSLDFPMSNQLYKTNGNLMIAGLMSPSDEAQSLIIQETKAPIDTQIVTGSHQHWTPTLRLAQLAIAQLSEHKITAVLNDQYYSLAIPSERRDAQLGHWHDAISDWYGQNNASVAQANPKFDAILQLELGRYRIFAGQFALEVLLKLIDPHTGQVFARTRVNTLTANAVEPMALYRDSEPFKKLLTEMSVKLLKQGFNEFGWRS
jgi:hypothetical protein